ncbi:MAG: hypothetical protein QXF14_03630 [Candidatus Woesearchaeota archaeon]
MAIKAALSSTLIILALLALPAIAELPDYCKPGTPAEIMAQGGNITWLNMCLKLQTQHWQGYAGRVYFGTAPQTPTYLNATGSLVNISNINFTVPCDNPTGVTGFIIFSNSTEPPIGLVPGDLSILDKLSGNGSDSGSKTFTAISTFDFTSGSITNVPTTFTYVNEAPQNTVFREGYFNQGANIVFATAIDINMMGYNRSYFDFQSLLFAPYKKTIPYYLFADITFICPPPGPGGGSGGYPGGCIVYWVCDPWGPCMPDGYQYRNCWPRWACPNMTGRLKPATIRACRIEPREELPEIIPETKIFRPGFLGNLSLNLTPDLAYILEPKIMNGTFANWNYLSLEDITYEVTTPIIYTAFSEAHPYPMILWNSMLGGWKDHGPAEARPMHFRVYPPAPLPVLRPRTIEPYNFTIIPPVMQPKVVDIGVSAYSGPSRVKSTIAPLIVEVHPFQVAAEWTQPGVITLYFVVDNRGKKEKRINIEFDLNRGKSTLESEMLGLLKLPTDSVTIYAHEYRLGKKAMSADRVEARLYTKEKTLKAGYLLR